MGVIERYPSFTGVTIFLKMLVAWVFIMLMTNCNYFKTGYILWIYKLNSIFPRHRSVWNWRLQSEEQTNEQACGQKLYTYMLQNISTPEIQLITYLYKTTLHILKYYLLVTYLQWNKAHTYTPYISHTQLQHTHLD